LNIDNNELSKQKVWLLISAIALIIIYFTIGLSIFLSPWFSWHNSALSDLGHAIKSSVSPIFNFGLFSSGLIFFVYSIINLRKHSKYTSIFFAGSAFFLQLIAVFDETYGFLHFFVSVLFFVTLNFTLLAYVFEKKSIIAIISFLIGSFSWIVYYADIFYIGVSVPEIISCIAITFWIIHVSLKINNAL